MPKVESRKDPRILISHIQNWTFKVGRWAFPLSPSRKKTKALPNDSNTRGQSHPKLGASWEGFALNQLIQLSGLADDRFFFWATQAGAEVDLFWQHNRKNYAAEFKYGDAPRRTRSMLAAKEALQLDHLWVIYPGPDNYPLDDEITVQSIMNIQQIFAPQA